MENMVIDGRGKAMVLNGRFRVAQQARFLRRTGAGNRTVRGYISSAKTAYLEDLNQRGWTYGQLRHNVEVPLR